MRQVFYATPKNHAVVKQAILISNSMFVIPILYLQHWDSSVRRFETLIEYFKENLYTSSSWKRTTTRAIGLFWDYLLAINIDFDWSNEDSHRQIIRNFSLALQLGTSNTEDSLDLNWPTSFKEQAKQLMEALLNFIHWCAKEKNFDTNVSIDSQQTISQETLKSFLYVARFQKNISFLSHLKNEHQIARTLAIRSHSSPVNFGAEKKFFNNLDPVKSFPRELIIPLLNQGFIVNPESEDPFQKEDITAKMIAYLLFFTGLRRSEPLHIWFNDVDPTNLENSVLLAHPEWSKTRLRGFESISRSDYLKSIGLMPRNLDSGSKSWHAGWKNMKMDSDHLATVYWISDVAKKNFCELAMIYFRYRENLIQHRLASGASNHPFFFVSNGVDQANNIDYRGAPYSYFAFEKSWNRALKRLAKILAVKLNPSKANGLTPHGARHFYGTMLKELGVDERVIQEALHHLNIHSQDVYTELSPQFVIDTLKNISITALPISDFKLL